MTANLGTFIRERRRALGLTQEQLAERVGEGMRQAEISRLEHDRIVLPRRSRLEQLAAALEVSLGDLLVQTGWLNDAHLTSQPNGVEHVDEEDLVKLESAAMMHLVTAVEQIAEMRIMMDQTAATLDRAERKIATAMRSINSGRGTIHLPVGVMDSWESSAPFII